MSIKEVLISKLNAIVYQTVRPASRYMFQADIMDLIDVYGLEETYMDGKAEAALVERYKVLWREIQNDKCCVGSRIH